MSISAWLPRLMTCSSAVPLISRVNRTQREHITQRSVNSVICVADVVLVWSADFGSCSREWAWPKR